MNYHQVVINAVFKLEQIDQNLAKQLLLGYLELKKEADNKILYSVDRVLQVNTKVQ